MRIDEDKQVINGEHKGIKFNIDGGVLNCFNTRFSIKKIKNFIDLCNLLQVQKVNIVDELPPKESYSVPISSLNSLWGYIDQNDEEE